MAEFKVLRGYTDTEVGRWVEDETIEMTIKRAEEIEAKLNEDGYTGPFLKRIDKPEPKETRSTPEKVPEDDESKE